MSPPEVVLVLACDRVEANLLLAFDRRGLADPKRCMHKASLDERDFNGVLAFTRGVSDGSTDFCTGFKY